MRLEIENTQGDFDGMAIKVFATSREECFELGKISESLHRDGVKFVQCTDDGVWLRMPLILKDNALGQLPTADGEAATLNQSSNNH